jgi:hypothetical protein
MWYWTPRVRMKRMMKTPTDMPTMAAVEMCIDDDVAVPLLLEGEVEVCNLRDASRRCGIGDIS